MYLYPFKIFALSKNKRLINVDEPNKPVGIYDVMKYNYGDALDLCNAGVSDAKVSILLGNIINDTKLIVLDLDDCYDAKGNIEPDTKKFLEEFDSNEWETSSSGTGIHIYILTKLKLETFIVKELEGCKSFECYTNKRHIVTTTFDFKNTNLQIGKHDKFIQDLYDRVHKIKNSSRSIVNDVKKIFHGDVVQTTAEINGKIFLRKPVTDMYTLRGLGYKDPTLIEIIDECPDAVDQSAHDAKLVRKLMYYTLSFESAWEMAKKTNYYKAKDDRHKRKFNDEKYIERTKKFIYGGHA